MYSIGTCSHVMNCQQIYYWYSRDELSDGRTEILIAGQKRWDYIVHVVI